MKHAMCILIEQLTINVNFEQKNPLRLRVKWWKDFLIIKLETIAPK